MFYRVCFPSSLQGDTRIINKYIKFDMYAVQIKWLCKNLSCPFPCAKRVPRTLKIGTTLSQVFFFLSLPSRFLGRMKILFFQVLLRERARQLLLCHVKRGSGSQWKSGVRRKCQDFSTRNLQAFSIKQKLTSVHSRWRNQ